MQLCLIVMEKNKKRLKMDTMETEYEITDSHLVDLSKVSKLKNRFSDRIFKRKNPIGRNKKLGRTVYFSEKLKEWAADNISNSESGIDRMLDEGII